MSNPFTYILERTGISAQISYTDEQLIKSILEGKKHLFKELYTRYENSLFTICLRYAVDREQAHDFFQDGMVKIFRQLEKYDVNKGAFYTWAHRVVVNVCLQKLRKKNALRFADEVSVIDQELYADPSVYSELGLEELTDMISSLPDGYRTVFNMYVVDGYSHKEIAGQLGVSVNTSKTQLFKARQLLQKKIYVKESLQLIG